jgi:hypothetical protein
MNKLNEQIYVINLAQMVDELAELKAAIAPLQEREQFLKDQLKATGRERIDGTEHTAVVSLSERETVDAKALRADLGEDIIQPYLRRALVTVIKLTARKTH